MKKTVETVDTAGNKITLDVRHPTGADMDEAELVRARRWQTLVEKGVKVKKQIDKMLKERGIWTDEEEKQRGNLVNRIIDLSNKLKNGKGMAKAEGRRIAIEIFKNRTKLQELLSERSSLDANSAESLAENSKFDYLVSVCTLNSEDGSPYFKDYDNYMRRKEEKAAWAAATKLAQMLYSDVDFEDNYVDNLIEVKFLKKFNYVNETNQLVDEKGNVLDLNGNVIPQNDLEYNKESGKLEFEFNEADFT